MRKKPEATIGGLDTDLPSDRTESGELERPPVKQRKIDCGVDQFDRRQIPQGADRRNSGFVLPPAAEA